MFGKFDSIFFRLTFLSLLLLPLDDDGLLVLPRPLDLRLGRSLRLADLSIGDSMPNSFVLT